MTDIVPIPAPPTPPQALIRVSQNSRALSLPAANIIDGDRSTTADTWATQDSGLSDYYRLDFGKPVTVIGVKWLNVTMPVFSGGHATLSTLVTNNANAAYGASPPRAVLSSEEVGYPAGFSLVNQDTSLTYSTPATGRYIYVTLNNSTNKYAYMGEFQWILAPTASMSVTVSGCAVTLTYATTDTTYVEIDNGVGPVQYCAGGTIAVNPLTDTTYTLTATGPGGVATAQATALVSGLRVSPNVNTGAISYFNGGGDYAAGTYWIVQDGGSYRYSSRPAYGFTINGNVDIRTPINGYIPGFKVTDGAGHVAAAPGLLDEFATAEACIAANTGLKVPFVHAGGLPIGVYLNDLPYDDNHGGAQSPVFKICGPLSVGLSASPLSLNAGDSATLAWTSSNAETLTIDGGVGSVAANGALSVSPSATTRYVITATYRGLTITDTVMIAVNAPEAPAYLAASGLTGGKIALSWPASRFVSGYLLERSADGMTGWTSVISQSGTGYMDTPPLPGAAYWYRVRGVSGSARSAFAASDPAASILRPPAAPTPTVTPGRGANALTWTLPSGSYGALTATLYRSTVRGSETPLLSGLTGASYTDGDLQNGVTYYYQLAFASEAGAGARSGEASGTPDASGEFSPEPAPASRFTQMSRTMER